MEVLEVRSPGQHDTEEMKGRTRARRSIGGLIGITSAPVNESSKCRHGAWDQRANHKQHGRGGDGRNRGEVLLRIVTERLLDVRVQSHRYGRREDHDRPVCGAVLQHVHTTRPPAPGRFSTMVEDANAFICSATSLAVTALGPPGGKPTRMRAVECNGCDRAGETPKAYEAIPLALPNKKRRRL